MKKLKNMITICTLFSCSTLYAESSKRCMEYWNQPIETIKVLKVVECEHIWEFGKNKISDSRLKVVNGLNLQKGNRQWQSTGECQQVLYKGGKYNIYNARYKEDRHDIWLIYNDKNAFAYFRKVTDKNQSIDLSCSQFGQNNELKYILNSYLKTNTSVSMQHYKVNDWYKE